MLFDVASMNLFLAKADGEHVHILSAGLFNYHKRTYTEHIKNIHADTTMSNRSIFVYFILIE